MDTNTRNQLSELLSDVEPWPEDEEVDDVSNMDKVKRSLKTLLEKS